MPTVFVIGAMRSGTSALYEFLGSHPDVFAPSVKEPHHFAFAAPPHHFGPGDAAFDDRVVLDEEDYRALFSAGSARSHRVDGSTLQLYLPGAAERLAAAVPDARVIALLRDPVDRAFSAWSYQRFRMFEPLDSFEAGLAAEDARIASGWAPIWHYRNAGRYADQLAPYVDLFGRQLLVLFLEEALADLARLRRRLAAHLDVSPDGFAGTFMPVNASGRPRSLVLQRVLQSRPSWYGTIRKRVPDRVIEALRSTRNRNRRDGQRLDQGLSARLRADTTSELERLEDLLGRPVPYAWRRQGAA